MQNFRNYIKREFKFSDGVTIIVGPNGIGKTNILEAVQVLSLGKSSWAVAERDLVNIDSSVGRVAGWLKNGDKLEIAVERKTDSNRILKVCRINGSVKRLATFTGNLRSVRFAPQEIRLVAGSPSRRRDFLDNVLGQIDSSYSSCLSKYNKVVCQRNKVLHTIHESQLSFWNDQLVKNGQLIQKKRQEFFDYAKSHLREVSQSLFAKGYCLSLEYRENAISHDKVQRILQKELATGVTQCGPHRDDFSFSIKNEKSLDLKSYGSRGQQRTAVLAIKVLVLKYFEEVTHDLPVLLLDDIFSELDDHYRQAVESIIKNQQTIITTADIKTVPETIKSSARLINL